MCLSRDQIEKLLRSEETSAELTTFRAHARACERCRAEAARVAERVLVGKVALQGGHLESATLSHYLDDGLSPHLRLLLDVHLEACGYCRERLEAMQAGRQHAAAQPVKEFSFQPVVEPPHRRRVLLPVWGFAAAATAIILIGLTVFARKPTYSDAVFLVAFSTSQTVRGVDSEAKRLLDSKWQNRKPVLLAQNLSPVRTLGPSDENDETSLISPLPHETLPSPRATIRWKEFQDVQEYELEVYGGNDKEKPLWKTRVKQPFVSVPEGILSPGVSYTYIVRNASDEDAKPLIPETAFSILSRKEAAELKQFEQRYPNSHLLRGIRYERMGLLSKARDEYRALFQENQKSPIAQKIYNQFEEEIKRISQSP